MTVCDTFTSQIQGPRVELEHSLYSLFVHMSFFSIAVLLPTSCRHTIRWIRDSKFPPGTNGGVCMSVCVCVYLSICVSSVIDRQHVQGFPCLLQRVCCSTPPPPQPPPPPSHYYRPGKKCEKRQFSSFVPRNKMCQSS